MQAVVITPGQPHSTRVAEVTPPRAGDGTILVRCLEVGVCGTDREIAAGHYGAAPPGEGRLVIGHEVLGQVESAGAGFAAGDLVTATVRRSCGHCRACAEGVPDSCMTGDYTERGITMLDGFASEVFAELPSNLVAVPAVLGRSGVLAEPASICARAIRHAHAIGERQPWPLRRALVIGAGAIGALSAAFLRLRDADVWVTDLKPAGSPLAQLIEQLGARYVCAADVPLADLRGEVGFDLVIEAAGSARLMLDALELLARNGVLCLLGIDNERRPISLDSGVIGVDAVIANRAVFGSVNASMHDWIQGLDDLVSVAGRWPGVLDAMVGARVAPDRFADAFAFGGVKATLCFAEPRA